MIRTWRRWARTALRQDRGSESIELIIVMPAVLLLMFVAVQAALLFQGRAVALAAAQEGVRVAASENGTASQGASAANKFAASTSSSLKGATATGSRTAERAQVTVEANVLSLVPGWTPTVTQSAERPVERITRP